jgi:hypothetical protein
MENGAIYYSHNELNSFRNRFPTYGVLYDTPTEYVQLNPEPLSREIDFYRAAGAEVYVLAYSPVANTFAISGSRRSP